MNDDYTDAILRSIADAEEQLADANTQLSQARINFNVAAIKYAALRDAAWERLGGGPHRIAGWPPGTGATGEFRFVRADPAKAIVEVLLEAGKPLTRATIATTLRDAHLNVPLRTLNAVLQGHASIERVGEEEPALYQFKKPEVDDLPF